MNKPGTVQGAEDLSAQCEVLGWQEEPASPSSSQGSAQTKTAFRCRSSFSARPALPRTTSPSLALTCPQQHQDQVCSHPGSCFPWTLCHSCRPEGLRHQETNCRQTKPQVHPVWRGNWSERDLLSRDQSRVAASLSSPQLSPLHPDGLSVTPPQTRGPQNSSSSPVGLPRLLGALLPGCRDVFGITELCFLEEGLSHGLPLAGCKQRGLRRGSLPSTEAHSLEERLFQANPDLGTGQGKLEHPGGTGWGRRHRSNTWWHSTASPYLQTCAAETAARCHCPACWRSG